MDRFVAGLLIGLGIGAVFISVLIVMPLTEQATINRMDNALIQYELQCEKDRREYCSVVVKDIRERVKIP